MCNLNIYNSSGLLFDAVVVELDLPLHFGAVRGSKTHYYGTFDVSFGFGGNVVIIYYYFALADFFYSMRSSKLSDTEPHTEESKERKHLIVRLQIETRT